MKELKSLLENTNKWVIRLLVLSIVIFIWLVGQFISQPSEAEVQSSYRCSTYYSKLYDQNRISFSFGMVHHSLTVSPLVQPLVSQLIVQPVSEPSQRFQNLFSARVPI